MRSATNAKATTQRVSPRAHTQSRAGPTAGHELSLRSLGNRAITIGERDDAHEREAERLAPRLAQGESVAVEGAVKNARLQLKAASSPQASAIAGTVQGSAHRGGPLPHRLREEYSAGLGANLSSVRVHTDTAAAQLNDRLHSRAVTWGSDIYFAAGEYNPHTQAGRELIAHETVHTVQQDFGRNPAAMRLQCAPDKSRDEVIQAIVKLEKELHSNGLNLEDLRREEGWREKLPGLLERKIKVPPDTIKQFILEYEQDYEKEIAALVQKAQGPVTSQAAAANATMLTAIAAARKRVDAAIRPGARNESFLELQAELLEVLRKNLTDPAAAKAASAMFGTGTIPASDLMNFVQALPLTQGTDEDELRIANASALHERLTGNLAAEVRNLKMPTIALEFWKDVLFNAKTPQEEYEENTQQAEQAAKSLEEQTGQDIDENTKTDIELLTEEERQLLLELGQQQGPSSDDPKKLLEQLKNMTPLEKKILEANKLLNQRSETAKGGDITLNLDDVETIASGSQAEQDSTADLSKAEQMLSLLSSKDEQKSSGIDLAPIRDALRAFQTELVMFKGLLRGAGRRYPELKVFESDLAEAIEHFFKELRDSMLKDLALDVVISLLPGGAIAALLRKIQKILAFIEKIRKILSIVDTVRAVFNVVTAAREKINVIESKLKAVGDLTSVDDFEELVFQLIDEHRLLDYLVLPEFDGLSEDEIQNEVLKIVRDTPRGLVAFGDMFTTYDSLPSDPSNDELAGLAVTSIAAGVLLSPAVVYLAMKALESIGSAAAGLDKSMLDRINPLKRRHRKRKGLKDRQDETKKKFDKARRAGYDYEAGPIKKLIQDEYKPALEAQLNDNANSFGAHAWTEPFFRHFVQEEVKALNSKRGTKRVSAKVKKKKKTDPDVTAMAPMLALKSPLFITRTFPWKVQLRTKVANTDVEIKPDPSKFYDLEYKHFAGSGIAYAPQQLTGKYQPRKRREIDRWLRKKNRYAFTYAVDPATGESDISEANKFIRMPGGNTLPGYLKIEAGFIKQGIDPDAYKVFLGKRLSGSVASRVNTSTVSSFLPPGYYAKKQAGQVLISGKPGAGTTQSLVWDEGLLAIGNKTRAPREINKNRLDETADVTYEPLDPPEIDKMVENMFAKDASGALAKPPQPDGNFKAQKATPKQWKDHIAKKPELRRRPTQIATKLGYTVNAKRKSLTSFHLPELKKSDDKGHLVAARFNGPDSLNNLVPMDSSLNQAGGDWFDMESKLAQAYIGRGAVSGDTVTLNVTLNYGSFVRRPDNIVASWSGSSVVKSDSLKVENP